MAEQAGGSQLPYKSIAAAIMFCVFLGPIGLLYATFWGGVIMSLITVVVVSHQFIFPIVLCWMICCIWATRAVENYNQKILKYHLKNS